MDSYNYFQAKAAIPSDPLPPLQIQRHSDGAFIPMDAGNSDYQRFLLEKAAGATVTGP